MIKVVDNDGTRVVELPGGVGSGSA